MTINFSHIGTHLGTRVLGESIRKDIEIALEQNQLVTFDFSGIDFISHSFADECFAKLLISMKIEELKKKTTFKDANKLVKRTIAFALKERMLQLETA
ncbi:STAS-like domain-containing protein [Pararhodonellum marinum]|uniref:STAS-like domain-containing protein n=1 Tax=Pararhodonellum marinum TaxID=2755358 RepID=UPI00188F18C7|nr:STAS-like domain-containing protein [Pararhodonellum marinum]